MQLSPHSKVAQLQLFPFRRQAPDLLRSPPVLMQGHILMLFYLVPEAFDLVTPALHFWPG